MADIVLHESSWIRAYTAYREFGAQSLFGETYVLGRTAPQAELLSMHQLYDVLYQQPDVMDEVDAVIMPYPTMVSKWYTDFSKKRRESARKGTKDATASVKLDKDAAADLRGYARAMEQYKNPNKNNTDWTQKYLDKNKGT